MDKSELEKRLAILEDEMMLSIVQDKDLIERLQNLEQAVAELIKQQKKK